MSTKRGFDVRRYEADYAELVRQIDQLANQYGPSLKESPQAEALRRQLADFHGAFEDWNRSLRGMPPAKKWGES